MAALHLLAHMGRAAMRPCILRALFVSLAVLTSSAAWSTVERRAPQEMEAFTSAFERAQIGAMHPLQALSAQTDDPLQPAVIAMHVAASRFETAQVETIYAGFPVAEYADRPELPLLFRTLVGARFAAGDFNGVVTAADTSAALTGTASGASAGLPARSIAIARIRPQAMAADSQT